MGVSWCYGNSYWLALVFGVGTVLFFCLSIFCFTSFGDHTTKKLPGKLTKFSKILASQESMISHPC